MRSAPFCSDSAPCAFGRFRSTGGARLRSACARVGTGVFFLERHSRRKKYLSAKQREECDALLLHLPSPRPIRRRNCLPPPFQKRVGNRIEGAAFASTGKQPNCSFAWSPPPQTSSPAPSGGTVATLFCTATAFPTRQRTFSNASRRSRAGRRSLRSSQTDGHHPRELLGSAARRRAIRKSCVPS